MSYNKSPMLTPISDTIETIHPKNDWLEVLFKIVGVSIIYKKK